MQKTIRLLLADDHAIVREGLKRLLALDEGILVVGEAVNGGQVLEMAARSDIDVIMLDMSMPGLSGTDLIGRLRARDHGIPILVLTMHDEPQIAKRALRAGAAGYLTKDSDPEHLLEAIRRVAGGRRYILPALAEQMVFEPDEEATLHVRLSDRELQILPMLARGVSLNDIADQLAISSKTVSTHKARLMQKMGFQCNAELIRYAMENGLLH